MCVTVHIAATELVDQCFQKQAPLIGCRDHGEEMPEGVWEEDVLVVLERDQTVQYVCVVSQEGFQRVPVERARTVDKLGNGLRGIV